MENSFFFSLGIWNWFILAGILGVLEMVAPGYFLIWYGLAALVVGGLALAIDISWQMQLIMYAVIGMGLLIASLRFAGSRAGESDRPMLNKRAKSYLGKTYTLIDDTSNGRGSVKVGDSIWSFCRSKKGQTLPKVMACSSPMSAAQADRAGELAQNSGNIMKASLTLIVGIGALAAVPPLFFINSLLRKRNKDYDRSHLIEGTVVELDFKTRNDGKAYPIVEYTLRGNTERFNNDACVRGTVVGDTVQIEIGADQKARIFTDINTKMVTVTGTYMVLFGLIGVSALGWHYLKL